MAQPGSARWPPAAALALLAASLVLPSLAVMQSHFRTRETLVYALAVFVLLFAGHRALAAGAFGWVGDTETRVLAAVSFAGLLAAFFWVYPMVNTSAPGAGSDRDDALNLAAGALLHGRFPYSQRTYLGDLITPMPGAVLLAAPFVLLGTSAWQNLFWLPALYLAGRRLLADPRLALLLWWSVLGLSPAVLQELVSGGDLLSNALYVPLLVLWTARPAPRPDLPPWRRLAPAGVADMSGEHAQASRSRKGPWPGSDRAG